jgi:hypothetical protein
MRYLVAASCEPAWVEVGIWREYGLGWRDYHEDVRFDFGGLLSTIYIRTAGNQKH